MNGSAVGSVLITGVSGQDGSYLAERLLAEGVEVHGLVRPAHEALLDPRICVHHGDLSDGDLLADLVRDVAPAAIYNLGALSSVFESWRAPLLTAEVTGMAVAHLLAAAQRLHEAGRPIRFLQASSSEIFGLAVDRPQHEGTEMRPVSPYGAAKAFAHSSTVIQRHQGLFASNVILYGHESPRRPAYFAARRITAGVAAIARGETDHLTLGNLDASRDFGWAPDFVDAMVRVLRHDEPGDFIVSTGETHTVREFVAAAFRVIGEDDWESRVRVDPDLLRPNDDAVQIGDATKLRAIGWRPTVDFAELVATLVKADLGRLGSP